LDAVEDENWLRVRLISWNLAGKVRAIGDQLAALCERRPDLVALQEVRLRSVPALRAGFAAMGLIHVAESVQLATAHKRRYGLLIASRWPLVVLPALTLPQPERVLAAVVSTPWGLVELHAAHIPPGTAYGWIKIATLEASSNDWPPAPRARGSCAATSTHHRPSARMARS
jgi:exonuclease III